MSSFAADVWKNLSGIDCSKHVDKKGQGKFQLSYLSWAWAWATLMEEYPESDFLFDDPVAADNGTVEVWVTVTIKDGDKHLSRRMWLPVMNHKNESIANPTSRQVSDCRMRCLTKCLALFGLGHYIYAGEDIPGNVAPEPEPVVETIDALQAEQLREKITAAGLTEADVCNKVRIGAIEALESHRFDQAMKWLQQQEKAA